MGNWLGSGDKPDSVISQPSIIGKLPEPYSITQIDPVLLVYPSGSGKEFTISIDSSYTAVEAVKLLQEKGALEGCQRFTVITHGFLSNKDTAWLHELKEAIREGERGLKQTVAILGWGGGADIGLLRYAQAASNCIETGRWLGEILATLKQAAPQVATYGIGHSLGGHLMGAAGRNSKALDRITGLDPAGVGFQDSNVDKRLNRLDATLVDVIHTDGMDLPYFGTLVPMGLVDFYPNYGWNQPSKDRSRSEKPDLEMDAKHHKVAQPSPYGGYISDSHGRAIDFFLWSVGHRGAFRTHLKLDGEPDVESAVHRIITTGVNGREEVTAEMGYFCDRFMDEQLAEKAQKQQQQGGPQASFAKPRSDDFTKYDTFSGCFYVHTNGTSPWS